MTSKGASEKGEESQFIGEDKKDAEGSYVANDETINRIERRTERAVVGHLGTKHFLIHHPTKEYTHKHTTNGHDELGDEEIEKVEKGHAKEGHIVPIAERQ